jgi:hypothetical protein
MRKSGLWGMLATLGAMTGLGSLDLFGPYQPKKRKPGTAPSQEVQSTAMIAAQEKRARRAERNRANEGRKHV